MNLITSIKTCLKKYSVFEGKASRSEFWWFFLTVFVVLLGNGTSWGNIGLRANLVIDDFFTTIVLGLMLFFPLIAVGARRLHDINRSGWWQLIGLSGIGLILLFVWWAMDEKKENK